MTYLTELGDFVRLHARAQRIPDRTVRTVLSRVEHDGDGSGSWVGEWSDAAHAAQARGRHLLASGLYGIARFPYVDGPARKQAHDACVGAFDTWRAGRADIVRRTVTNGGGSFTYYATGLDASTPRPLLVVIGGIVSLKEQWAQFLGVARQLGVAVTVTEMPGVGENTLRYGPDSWTQVSALLDDVAPLAGVSDTFVVGMSFGGHLALQCARHDGRIRGIGTVGAPLRAFFEPAASWPAVPEITRRTLAHTTGLTEADLLHRLPAWAVREEELRALEIPLYYVASRRDEIIPREETATIARSMPRARVLEFDDVHGSPNHLAQVRSWLALAIFSWRGLSGPRPWLLRVFLRARPGRRVGGRSRPNH